MKKIINEIKEILQIELDDVKNKQANKENVEDIYMVEESQTLVANESNKQANIFLKIFQVYFWLFLVIILPIKALF